ncbi:MAG: hypothetical protein ACK5MD_10090 [Flavobacteriales bacterium]
MKKTIQKLAVIGVLVFGITQMNAQEKTKKKFSEKDIQEMKEKRLERMSKRLELSDNQIAQVKNIEAKYADEEKALHEEMKTKCEANRTKHEAMRKEMDAVLTSEQREKMKPENRKHEKRGDRKMKEPKPFDGERENDINQEGKKERFNKMKEDLGLSDTQVTKIKAIQEKYKPTESEKNQRKALREKGETLREKKMNEIKQILNSDQKAKMEKMQEKMKKHSGKRMKHKKS